MKEYFDLSEQVLKGRKLPIQDEYSTREISFGIMNVITRLRRKGGRYQQTATSDMADVNIKVINCPAGSSVKVSLPFPNIYGVVYYKGQITDKTKIVTESEISRLINLVNLAYEVAVVNKKSREHLLKRLNLWEE